MPITGQVINRFEPIENYKCIEELIRISSQFSWLEGLPANASFQLLKRFLIDCLDHKEWNKNPTESRLYEFLALCWPYSELQVLIHQKMSDDRWTGPARKAFLDSIINYTKKKPEKEDRSKEKFTPEADEESTLVSLPANISNNAAIFHDPTRITENVNNVISLFMNNSASVWQRGGLIVTVKISKKKKRYVINADDIEENLSIVMATKNFLIEMATLLTVNYVPHRYSNESYSYKPASCPSSTIEHLLDRRSYPFDVLEGVVTAPTIRQDGTIINEKGYDKKSSLYYMPFCEYEDIEEDLTIEDAKESLNLIRNVFSDYWFKNPYDESAAISAILTILSRHLYETAPLFSVTSTTAGIGKSKLVNCINIISTGKKFPFTEYSKKSEDMAKRMLDFGLEGDQVVVFDNIDTVFGGGILDQVLTNPMFKGRLLSTNTEPTVRINATFFATGNNIQYKGDTSRRVIPIVLEAKIENPEDRSDFEIEDLEGYVSEHHAELHKAALVILTAYIRHGKPRQRVKPLGSFEGWSNLVRSSLVWLGMPDPCTGRASIKTDSDIGFEALQTLLYAWRNAFDDNEPLSLKDAIGRILADRSNPSHYGLNPKLEELGNALLSYDLKANGDIGKLSVQRLMHGIGKLVTDNKSRIIDDMQLMCQKERRGTRLFWVQDVETNFSIGNTDTTIDETDSSSDSLSFDKLNSSSDRLNIEDNKIDDFWDARNSDDDYMGYMFNPDDDELPEAPF